MNDPIAMLWYAAWAISRGWSWLLYWTVFGPMEESFKLTVWLRTKYAQRRNAIL